MGWETDTILFCCLGDRPAHGSEDGGDGRSLEVYGGRGKQGAVSVHASLSVLVVLCVVCRAHALPHALLSAG